LPDLKQPGLISAVIATLNSARTLPRTLDSLEPSAGLIAEIVVSDGGSADATAAIAESSGARIVIGEKGRGGQLRRGAAASSSPWLLFLHADTALEESWADEVRPALADTSQAGAFALRFDAEDWRARVVESGAMVRSRLFALPYGDQGLLISRKTYDEIGGFRDMLLFEDVDLVDRLRAAKGRRALRIFRSHAITSADRYADGYARRVLRNFVSLTMYRAGVAPARIARFYERTGGRKLASGLCARAEL